MQEKLKILGLGIVAAVAVMAFMVFMAFAGAAIGFPDHRSKRTYR
jgi:hypothetical protein